MQDVSVSWLIPGRILYSPGTIDRDLIFLRTQKSLALLESEGQPPMVHTLIDHSNRYTTEEIAQQPVKLSYYMNLTEDEARERLISHPMFGWVISIATPNAGMKMAGAIISQRKNYRWHSVLTIEDAFHFLQERDVTLADLDEFPLR